MAMGGPGSIEEVEPYLLDVRGGRPTPFELVEEIRERYRLTGGASPVLAISRRLAGLLERRLAADGHPGAQVHLGMRHWHPYIADAYRQAVSGKPAALVAICLAPQDSRLSVGRYFEALSSAREAEGDPVPVVEVRSWCRHPQLVEAFAANLNATLARFASFERDTVPIVFTAHSLPARVRAEGDPYPGEVAATAAAVAERVGRGGRYHIAYQSQGRSAEPWLGPDVREVVEKLARGGARGVVVAPIGFVSDHVETLYDLDVDLRARAGELAVRLERTPMPNDGQEMVDALADLVGASVASPGR